MKLVLMTSSMDEATQVKARLEEAGIPAMISGENVAAIQLPFFSSNLGVFVYLNQQYDDAMALLADPHYQVKTGIDVTTFYETIDSEAMHQYLEKKNNHIIITLGIIIVLVLTSIVILD